MAGKKSMKSMKKLSKGGGAGKKLGKMRTLYGARVMGGSR